MGAGTVMLMTGIVWVSGRWSEGTDLTDSFAVGAFVTLLGVAIVNAMSDTLALTFAILLLVASLLRYGLSISRGIGWSE